ncbi:MAG: pyridoxine 5'-phosphate synthase [candidate division NC10 bacterium]|nr:pyridoxine 5'-phosphate synthase [candidate division NC10 bacterium]
MKPRLAVNVDHIATIRQARRGVEPDPVAAAILAEVAGASGIIVHLREDRRHIQDRDLRLLREVVKTQLNLEMAATEGMVKIALDVLPDVSTLVPERREELTTEGGLDVAGQEERISRVVRVLTEGEINVSLFVDPVPDQVKASRRTGVPFVEIHTGQYAEARTEAERQVALLRIMEAARLGRDLGLRIAAGHGLNYQNVAAVAAIPEVEELNIGHSIVARAALVGLNRAVREMVGLIHGATQS